MLKRKRCFANDVISGARCPVDSSNPAGRLSPSSSVVVLQTVYKSMACIKLPRFIGGLIQLIELIVYFENLLKTYIELKNQ